jgi:hypothetical protein
MFDPIPLPDPPCGATLPDGDYCPSPSAAIVAAEHSTGAAVLLWRCQDHIGASVDHFVRACPDAVITVTPLTVAEPAPPPDSPHGGPLRLVKA